MSSTPTLITDLAIVTAVAAVTGMAARRLGQPAILGYLSAGLIVGPYIPIPLFADPHRIEALAEIGVVLVLFAVGLEFRIKRLLEIIPVSGLTAVAQIATLSWAGYTVGRFMAWSVPASVTLGCTLAISSTMVVSGVLRTRPVEPDVRGHVFGILVVQDVVAILLMAVVTTLSAGQELDPASLLQLIAKLTGVVLAMLALGMLVVPRLVRAASAEPDGESLAVLAAGVGFAFAAIAALFGYSPALGAFISGMVVSESGRGRAVEHAIDPLRAMFSAIFFVSIGMTVDPIVAWHSLPFALGLSAVVVGMQLVSVTLASVLSGSSLRKGLLSALALGQIGELSFILAAIATAGGLVPPETLPALVTVATITAFTTPVLLGRGDAIVHAVDRALPDRVHHVLTAYHVILRQALAEGDGPSIRLPARAMLMDWAALVLLALLRGPVKGSVESGAWLVDIGTLVVAAPFLVGLVRSARGWALALGQRSLRSSGSPALAQTVEALATFAAVLWIGLPTLAIASPLTDSSVPEIVLAVALAVSGAWMVRRGTDFSDAYTSGVTQIARRIGVPEQDAPPDAPSEEPLGPSPLDMFEHVPIALPPGAAAVGQTLTQLDLRSRTGATVIAICHDADNVVLPTGHESLRAGDRLAVTGSPDALDRARTILVGPPG